MFLHLISIFLFFPGFSFVPSEAQEHSMEFYNRAAPGDARPPISTQGTYAVKVDVDSVFLNLSVQDRASNRSLIGLQKDDFLVYEDGVQQEVAQFVTTQSPFNLLLLLDVSGSTKSYLKMMKQAAIEFTHRIDPNDNIAVATFNTKFKMVQKFTGDTQEAERAIQHIKSGGGTAFYDALMAAIKYLKGMQGRNAIVVFTDGVDNQLEGVLEYGSRMEFGDLFRQVQETDALVYSIFLNTEETNVSDPGIGVGSPSWPGGVGIRGLPRSFPFPFPFPPIAPNPDRSLEKEEAIYMKAWEQLKQIADQTGGRMYSPTKINELSGAYSEIADDLRIQYQIGYNSANHVHDGKWRRIRVELEGKPDAVIRTRRGYYARKDAMP